MDRTEQLDFLLRALYVELPAEKRPALPEGYGGRRRLLRALMNLRPPAPAGADFLRVQDAFLAAEAREKGIVDAAALPACPHDPKMALWQGDITRLAADGIVNAANSALLGCFAPCHGCIDNAIHSAAGVQLRAACDALMRAQGRPEPPGRAKITPGFNLPARFVLHTVGPIVDGAPTARDRALLESCYRACLARAAARGLKSVAFCCISTGEFRFPRADAAEIAVGTIRAFLKNDGRLERVVCNVYQTEDRMLYENLLGIDR